MNNSVQTVPVGTRTLVSDQVLARLSLPIPTIPFPRAAVILLSGLWFVCPAHAVENGLAKGPAPGGLTPFDDGDWPVADPRDYGYPARALDAAVERIGREEGVYSLLLVRGGRLIVERYFREGTRTKFHNLKSASKSIVSALVGLVIADGRLSLDDRVVGRLQVRGRAPGREGIRVRHLLTMTSGLGSTSHGAYHEWVAASDWVGYALARPVMSVPGESYRYSTGNTHLLSALVSKASGMSTRSFAERRLFGPLRIEVGGWDRDPQGIHLGGNNLSMTPRDFAKIGELYLRGGNWRGRQVVPRRWVRESTRGHVAADHELFDDYGYHWFVPGAEYRGDFAAVGFGGQYLYVSPRFDSVVVVTATLESKGRPWERRVVGTIQRDLLAGGRVENPPATQRRFLEPRRQRGEIGGA